MAVTGRATEQDADELSLRRLGYAQQLLRRMGGFESFALSFSVISILTGAVTLYGHGLSWGGPRVMLFGWPLVALLTLPVAASLSQLASSYPTAGALYHWAAILGGRGWGFLTAWLNTIGQAAITAGIDYGLAQFVAPMLGMPADRPHLVGICAAVLASHGALNHLGVRAVARLNSLSAWVHLAGVAAIVLGLWLFAPSQPAAFLLAAAPAPPAPAFAQGHAGLYGFLVGLLLAGWTFTGYDASAHGAEETHDATRNAPWGIVLSVAVSAIAGWALLVAVTLAIRDLPAAVAAENPFVHVLEGALGTRAGGALVWVAMAAMWFCGLASVTSNSRMLFAFARDGGLPFSAQLARVSPRFRSPQVSVWTACAAALAVALWSDAYAAMTALSTIALYASYGVPIFLGLRARRSGRWQRRGPWDLGRFSGAVNLLALLWIGGLVVLFVLPPNQLAGWTFGACLLVLGVAWRLRIRDRFRGPPASG